jgi:2-dehydro-3-deoxygalactonokinase
MTIALERQPPSEERHDRTMPASRPPRESRLSVSGPLLLVDWGTSSRRAWLLGEGGELLACIEDGLGMRSVPAGGWEEAFADLKQSLGGTAPRRTLIAGMAGADRGWRPAPYLPCPAGIEDLAGGFCRVAPAIAIVPGLSCAGEQSSDVMRGEETQVLGAVTAGLVPPDCFACLPGTHTKWVAVREGRVTGFRTVITGEMFALLREHGVLSAHLAGEAAPGSDFDNGLRLGLAGREPAAELFRVRSDALLGLGRIGSGASYASGLLIGADVRAGLALGEEREVCVIGRSDLAEFYAAALAREGRAVRKVDGGEAALAGLRHLAELEA